MEKKPVIERKQELPGGSKEIFLAGGCFWGLEKYLSDIRGVTRTSVGYANGTVASPTYEQVCTGTTGCAETVHVVYKAEEVSLAHLLKLYMKTIDPTSLNRQGPDVGEQYRTGIYYVDEADLDDINSAIKQADAEYVDLIVVEVEPLASYYLAEEYHQGYVKKNQS